MRTIGVKQLKEHLSEVLREIEATGQIIGVSNRGRIVARLVPAQLGQRARRDPRAAIAEIDALSAEISAGLTGTINVTDIISDMRR